MKKKGLPKKLRNLERLRRLNVAIVSHIFATGPALDLEEFLKSKTRSLFFVGHPFSYRKEINSFYKSYQNGKLVIEYKAIGWRLPEVLFYLKDSFYTLWWLFWQKNKFDYYIGSDNFSAFLGLILKKLGKVDNVIFYTIDYIPQRFKNPILNSLYHFFDKQCLKHCKIVWNVSPVMAGAREKHANLRENENTQQITVPLGMWYKRIPHLPFEERERYQMVFMGHLIEKQGLDVVVSAMPKIVKKFPRLKLVIMGTGDYENKLKDLVKRLKLEKFVKFTGYVEKHEDIERELARSAISVAMYKPDPKSFTNWADPGKLKNYLAAGAPVILTSVPPVAREIESEKCGIIAEYNTQDFTEKAIKILGDSRVLKRYSRNAVLWAKQFDWDVVFSDALTKTLDE